MSISYEIFKEESLNHSTEEKLIGWLLVCPESPQAQELAKNVNHKNLTPYGRIILRRMIEVIDKYPDSCQYGRMQAIAFQFAVYEMKIPWKYVARCMDAGSCWTLAGPTEAEIKELTA